MAFIVTNKVKFDAVEELSSGNGVTVVSYPTFNNRYFCAINSADTTGIVLASSWVDMPWDTEKRKDTIYTHSTVTNNDRITINETGDYEVTLDVSTDVSSGNSRTISEIRLVKFTGTSDIFISGSLGKLYNRTSTGGGSTSTVSLIETFTANEIIKAQVRVLTGTNNVFVESDATRINLKKL